jgi:hypothetical protein
LRIDVWSLPQKRQLPQSALTKSSHPSFEQGTQKRDLLRGQADFFVESEEICHRDCDPHSSTKSRSYHTLFRVDDYSIHQIMWVADAVLSNCI